MKRGGRRHPPLLGVRGEAGLRRAVVAGRARGQHEEHVEVEAGRVLLRLGDELRAAHRVAQHQELLLQRQPVQGLPGRAAVEGRPALEAEQHTDAPCRRLWTHAPAERVLLLGEADDLAEQLGPAVRLDQPEGDRATRTAGHLAHPGQLGPGAGQVLAVALAEAGSGLEDAPPVAAEHIGKGEELVRRGPGAGDRTAVGDGVQQRPRGREPQRAGVHGLVDQLRHRRDVVLGGRRVVQAALAHGVVADGAVADHPADVRTLGEATHGAEVLAVGDPVPRQTAEDGVPGDVLDALHQLGQVRAVLGAAGRERDAAVAHDHAGHAVPAARRADRIPCQLSVQVRVGVDETGRHDPAVSLDLAVSPAAQRRLDRHHTVTDDAYVRDALPMLPNRRRRCHF